MTAPNKFHGFDFVKATTSNTNELARIALDGTLKYKSDMPEIHCYTPQEFSDLLTKSGFGDVTVYGYPVTIYPDAGDTKHLKESTSSSVLSDPNQKRHALALEKRLCLNPDNAYRGGSNLFAVARKSKEMEQVTE